MNDTVAIWIVDDERSEAEKAFSAVKEAVRQARSDLDPHATILWANEFDWPPVMRTSVDPEAPPISGRTYPDIIVLDLVKKTPNGDILRGDAFYDSLRTWETSRRDGKPALVILWSIHQAGNETAAFVRRVQPADQRLIPLATKQPVLLKTKLIQLWKRIVEERENC